MNPPIRTRFLRMISNVGTSSSSLQLNSDVPSLVRYTHGFQNSENIPKTANHSEIMRVGVACVPNIDEPKN